MDRRRSKRFTPQTLAAHLALVSRGQGGPRLERCDLLNLSYGGMCFRCCATLDAGLVLHFLVDLQSPFHALVLVKARVVWTARTEQGVCWGAEFLESSQGWLGPEESFSDVLM